MKCVRNTEQYYCSCSQVVVHNYCSPIMICKTLKNTTFCKNHFNFYNCFIVQFELAAAKYSDGLSVNNDVVEQT